jgi:hypothetical protein
VKEKKNTIEIYGNSELNAILNALELYLEIKFNVRRYKTGFICEIKENK